MKKIISVILLSILSFIMTTSPTLAANRDILIPPGINTTWHGVYLPNVSTSQITSFEKTAGKKIGAQLTYIGWYVGAFSDLQKQINVWEPMGIKTHVAWEPTLPTGGDSLAAILNGSQDSVINDFATRAKAYGKPFFLRFAHEMNGDWYDWSGASTGKNPQKYIDAWRYVWSKFQAIGATNAVWVWSPNAWSVPDETWNDLHNYYPGDQYVDWVGVDFYGLMWGDNPAGPALDQVYTSYNYKPIMVSETAAADCRHYSGSMKKDAWIKDFFISLNYRPQVKAFFWFNVNKEADWRINSCPNPQGLKAYQSGIRLSKFVTR